VLNRADKNTKAVQILILLMHVLSC